MNGIRVVAAGVCAPGLARWADAQDMLAGGKSYVPAALPRLASTALPATERRRANATSRLALEAACDAVRGRDPAAIAALATVFASADGDGDVLTTLLRDLAGPLVRVSPTTFHNSVFNAPAGYWSIAMQARGPSTSICAGEGTFAAALLEAAGQVAERDVLVVAYDHAFPPDAPIGTSAREPFACALLLTADAQHDATGATQALATLDGLRFAQAAADALAPGFAGFAGNAAAAALPLLAALAARRSCGLALPYLEDRCLLLEVRCP